MTWLAWLKSLPELENRVFYPDFPQKVPSGLFAHCEYPTETPDEGRFADAYSGVRLLDIYLYQPPSSGSKGQDTTLTTPLTDLANKVWRGIIANVSDDLTPGITLRGSFRAAMPGPHLSDDKFGRFCRVRVSFRVMAG